MSATVTRTLILLAALLVLAAVNYSIFAKERIISSADSIYLELAPVDPRSLMQGDYMALRFQVADQIASARVKSAFDNQQRSAPLMLDSRRVATLASPADETAVRIRYQIRHGQVWLGTNAYFFEEGSAQRLSGARYGEFKLDPNSGEAVLVGLRDKELKKL